MSEEQLNPCHFCRGHKVYVAETYKDFWHVKCITCGCTGLGEHDFKESAIKGWNEDKFCMTDFNIKKAKKCPFCGSHPNVYQENFFGHEIRLGIRCRKIFCGIEFQTIKKIDKFDAVVKRAVLSALIQKWNRRMPNEQN